MYVMNPFTIGRAAAAPAAAPAAVGASILGPIGMALGIGQTLFGMVSRQNAINEAKDAAFKANQINVDMKKEEYQRVIADARARVGASGVTTAGSPAAVLAESARQAERNLFNMRAQAPPRWKAGANRDQFFDFLGDQIRGREVEQRRRLPGVDWGF